jgi:hypothetical protein
MFPQPVKERDINRRSKKNLMSFVINFSYNIPRRESNVSSPSGDWVDQVLAGDEFNVFWREAMGVG